MIDSCISDVHQTLVTNDDREHASNMQEMEDYPTQRPVSEVLRAQEAQDDVNSTPLGSAVEGSGSTRNSASGVLSIVARASIPSTASPPPNRSLDDGVTPD
jgi:hypothetical protein